MEIKCSLSWPNKKSIRSEVMALEHSFFPIFFFLKGAYSIALLVEREK